MLKEKPRLLSCRGRLGTLSRTATVLFSSQKGMTSFFWMIWLVCLGLLLLSVFCTSPTLFWQLHTFLVFTWNYFCLWNTNCMVAEEMYTKVLSSCCFKTTFSHFSTCHSLHVPLWLDTLWRSFPENTIVSVFRCHRSFHIHRDGTWLVIMFRIY